MRLAPIRQNIPKRTRQNVQMRGINLTDRYTDGEMESCRGISTDRYPYITTQEQPVIVDVAGQAINQWDEEWEIVDGKLTSKNYIPVIAGETYCFVRPVYNITPKVTLNFYDSDHETVGFQTNQVPSTYFTFTAPTGAAYCKFNVNASYGDTYNNDLSLNYPATYTTYHAYTENVNCVSMFAWEQLFVVSDVPHGAGYKCFYGGNYCGDTANRDLPKQYAVVNSKLVMYPDKIYFNLYDETMSAHQLGTAPRLMTINSGEIIMRKAVTV